VKRSKLLFADSERSADMLYASGFRAPDPFTLLIEPDGTSSLLLNNLEVDRGRREASVDSVESLSDWEKSAGKKAQGDVVRTIAHWLEHKGVKSVEVPLDFPFGIVHRLRKRGIKCSPCSGEMFPERAIKDAEGIRAARAAARLACKGMERAREVLQAAEIRRGGKLYWWGKRLTAELLRSEIEVAVVRAGGEARGDTICACGEQACDPHERGSGPLRAGELLIIDIFPRVRETGFFGDITRTFVKGQASDEQRLLWETCLQGQKMALKGCRPGASGLDLQNRVREFFTASGYPTEVMNSRWRGFFHGLGHGLGLEVHEAPRLASTKLAEGQVVTVEPGIYWPGIGGVRHEDTILVQEKAPSILTRFPKQLEIE